MRNLNLYSLFNFYINSIINLQELWNIHIIDDSCTRYKCVGWYAFTMLGVVL